MNDIDLKLQLLSGIPFEVPGAGMIYPLSLKEIARVGYTTYLKYVYLFTLDLSKVLDNQQTPEVDGIELNGFDVIANSGNEGLINDFVEASRLFFRVKEAQYSLSYQKVFLGDFSDTISDTPSVSHHNFPKIKDITEYQNGVKNVGKSEEFNPESEKAKAMAEKFKKGRSQIKQAKQNEGSDEPPLDLFDIISSVSSKAHGLNKINVWDLTLYQLYDEFRRLEAIEHYNITIQSLLHGADSRKVSIKHWSSKLDGDS